MRFEDIDVHTLLPQQEPFVMIDQLLHFDEVMTTTRFTVREDHLYVEDGRLNACALIENIAQTCAARMGYINHYIYKKEVQLGFIGSVKNLVVKRVPLLGETLTTTIKVMEEIMQLTLVQAEIKVGEETIVTAEMKIALSEKTVK
ncbi:MAG: pseudouridylate synthase [Prevotella sp.]|nr:pseudouridylate synthase [Prevotella sp.]